MSDILQGTTPSLEIKIDTSDFLVNDVIQLEFVTKNKNVVNKYGLSDMTVDTEANSFIYTFTEADTLSMTAGTEIIYQLRFKFSNGSIVGTKKMKLNVSDLISEEEM